MNMDIGGRDWLQRIREADDCVLDEFLFIIDSELKKTWEFEKPIRHGDLRSCRVDVVNEIKSREELAASVREPTGDKRIDLFNQLRCQLRTDVLKGNGKIASAVFDDLANLMAEVKTLDNMYGEGWL